MDLQTRIDQADQDVRAARQALFSAQEKWEAASQDEKPQFRAFYDNAWDDLKVQRQNLQNLSATPSERPTDNAHAAIQDGARSRLARGTVPLPEPSPSELANVDAVLKSFPGLRGQVVDASTKQLMVHHRLFTKESLTDMDGKLSERLMSAGFPLGFVLALLEKETKQVEVPPGVDQGNAMSFESVLSISVDKLQPFVTRSLKFLFGRRANQAAQGNAGTQEAPGSAQPRSDQPRSDQPGSDQPGSAQSGSDQSEIHSSEPVPPPPTSSTTSTSTPPPPTTSTLKHRLGFCQLQCQLCIIVLLWCLCGGGAIYCATEYGLKEKAAEEGPSWTLVTWLSRLHIEPAWIFVACFYGPIYLALGYPKQIFWELVVWLCEDYGSNILSFVVIPSGLGIGARFAPMVFLAPCYIFLFCGLTHALWLCKYPAHLLIFAFTINHLANAMAVVISGLDFSSDTWMDDSRLCVMEGIDPLYLNVMVGIPKDSGVNILSTRFYRDIVLGGSFALVVCIALPLVIIYRILQASYSFVLHYAQLFMAQLNQVVPYIERVVGGWWQPWRSLFVGRPPTEEGGEAQLSTLLPVFQPDKCSNKSCGHR